MVEAACASPENKSEGKEHMAQANRATGSGKKVVKIGEETLTRGSGGELHQTADGDTPVLTTNLGSPVSDDQNSLKIGTRGPTALEDFHFREKIFHFDHERIPERVVHARGFGAHGFFEPYESLADVTRADLLQRPGERTPLFIRFSTVAGSKGSADLARDVRLRRQILYKGGKLGSRWQQHSRFLHPRRDQVSRPDSCGEAGARPRLPAGTERAR